MKIYKTILLLFLFIFTPIYPLRLGIENIPILLLQKLKTKKIALISNQTSVDQKRNRTVDILFNKNIPITYLLAPEHGIRGTIVAGQAVSNGLDAKTKIPVISLYKKGTGKHLDVTILKNIDVIMFDIQDAGMRHYTYISTLLYALQKAAEHSKQFIVLDRPNLLGGHISGPLVTKELQSFIGIAPIPLRYGLTIGELARFFNANVLQKKVNLIVIKMKDYIRNKTFALLAPLSPNIKSIQSCYGYSFLGLLGEVRPFDVGVGTSLAFRCILLPDELRVSKLVWKQCASLMHKYGIGSKLYHYFSDRKKKWYTGLQLHIKNIHNLRSFELFLDLVQLFKKQRVSITFSDHFDKAVGTQLVQLFFSKKITHKQLVQMVQKDLRSFAQKMQKIFLYSPMEL